MYPKPYAGLHFALGPLHLLVKGMVTLFVSVHYHLFPYFLEIIHSECYHNPVLQIPPTPNHFMYSAPTFLYSLTNSLVH